MLDAPTSQTGAAGAADRSHPPQAGGGPPLNGHLHTHWHVGACKEHSEAGRPGRARPTCRRVSIHAYGPIQDGGCGPGVGLLRSCYRAIGWRPGRGHRLPVHVLSGAQMWAAEALQRRHVGEYRHAVVVASPVVGLDIYAGPVTRYVAGDWLTIVQQAGAARGIPVEVIRPNEPADAIHDASVVEVAVGEWQGRLLQSLDVVGDGGPTRPTRRTRPTSRTGTATAPSSYWQPGGSVLTWLQALAFARA